MPPKKDIPQGLKDFLAKPKNAKKQKEAIVKNKAVRAKKPVKTNNTIEQKLLALKLSADSKKLLLPNELLNLIKDNLFGDYFTDNGVGYKKVKSTTPLFHYDKDSKQFVEVDEFEEY
jgi:hypothetical protein